MKAILKYNGKKIEVEDIKIARSLWSKALGLMFQQTDTNAVLFEFEKPAIKSIHSFFVFFPFIAVWLDKHNKIIEKRIVQPFTPSVKPKKEFSKLLEIPFNNNYYKAIDILVGK